VQTNRKSDEAVYNRAVVEVEKILLKGRLSEKSLKKLQDSFLRADFIGVRKDTLIRDDSDNKNICFHQGIENPKTFPSEAVEKEMYLHSELEGLRSETAFVDPDMAAPPDLRRVSRSLTPSASNRISGSKSTVHTAPKGNKLDAWSLITIHNDMSAAEELKLVNERQTMLKLQTRQHLLEQIQHKVRIKQRQREVAVEEAQEVQRQVDLLRVGKDQEAQIRREKLAVARQLAATEKANSAAQREAAAARRLQEEKLMLTEFQRQIDEEKERKGQAAKSKHQQYLTQQEENGREQERKLAMKQREREDNERLFQLQIEMAEKQEVPTPRPRAPASSL
jgi:hypothetical protein